MSYHPTDYHDAGRAYTPTSMGRPRTPGTPGTFDSGVGRFQSQENFHGRYDDPRQSRNTSAMAGDTYYFNKEGGRAAAATGAGAGAAGIEAGRRGAATGQKNWFRRHPWLVALIVLVIIAAVGGGVGGYFGTRGSSNNSDLATNSGSDSASGGSSSSSKGSGSSTAKSGGTKTTAGATPAATTSAAPSITPLPKWNMTDPNSKIYGVSIGNWLVLERWLMEDWFTATAGDNAWDEWSFTESLGTGALPALQAHWNSWVNESSLDALKSVGVNAVRIPVGYWAFVDTINGEPYLAKSGQTDQLQKMLGWLYDRGMYALIDLHGMPGSQNGDQSSGHNTSNPTWFDSDNFGYTYTVLNATLDWIAASNYSSVVQWLCPVNEPRANGNSGKQAQILSYYETAYTQIKNAGLIMMFHNGFEASPMSYWQDFATGKDPNHLVYNNNPYYGWFPPNSDSSGIISSTCNAAQATQGYPVPVVMTEYSAINGVGSTSFTQEYLTTQISAYAWSGGSFFWNFRADHSTSQVLAIADANMNEYSFTTLIAGGVITAPANTGETTIATIKALPNTQCGDIPTASWTNPSTDTS